MDDVFRALADPSRRRLLDGLNAHDGQTLRELCAGLDMTRQAVAKHLAVLETAGLVTTRRRGREKLHHLNAAPVTEIADRWIRPYHRGRAEALADLKLALESTEGTDGTVSSTETEQAVQAASFVYVTYIRTTPEKLWAALTETAFVRRYFDGGGPRSEWTVGAPVHWSMGGDDPAHDWDQQVLEADPPRRLAYTWHNYQPEMQEIFGWSDEELARLRTEKRSRVSFEIERVSDEAVRLTVVHDGFEPDSEMLRGVSGGWPGILSNLKSLLETGTTVTGG